MARCPPDGTEVQFTPDSGEKQCWRNSSNVGGKIALFGGSAKAISAAFSGRTQKYLNETILRGLHPELKENMVEQFMNRLIAIEKAPNPFLAFREELGNTAIAYADLQVLCLTPEEKAETFGEIRYISGELSSYIRQCAKFNQDVARIIWEQSRCTDDELFHFTKVNGAVLLYYLNGLNLVRVATKIDPPAHSAGKDWFQPFIRSMLISAEHAARQKLGLPTLCADDIAPLRHSSFVAIVARGAANPLFEWERGYGRKHSEEC